MTEKAVFFDIDDTLLDTSHFAETARQAAIEAMVENGLPLEKDEAYELLKKIISEKGSNYNKHFNVLTKEVLGKEDPFLIALGMTTYHNVKFALLRPFPRTTDILLYLREKGYRLGAISNGITIKQWEKLIRLRIHSFFDSVITSQEIGIEKPNVEIFQEAMKQLNCKAEKSIMVGNKLDIDIMGAVNSGMKAVLVNSHVTPEEEEKIKDLKIKVLKNIGELDKIL